jgi:hypothetical protein
VRPGANPLIRAEFDMSRETTGLLALALLMAILGVVFLTLDGIRKKGAGVGFLIGAAVLVNEALAA